MAGKGAGQEKGPEVNAFAQIGLKGLLEKSHQHSSQCLSALAAKKHKKRLQPVEVAAVLYSVEYLAQMQEEFLKITGMCQEQFVHGSGKRKTPVQKLYERMDESRKKLKGYRKIVTIHTGQSISG